SGRGRLRRVRRRGAGAGHLYAGVQERAAHGSRAGGRGGHRGHQPRPVPGGDSRRAVVAAVEPDQRRRPVMTQTAGTSDKITVRHVGTASRTGRGEPLRALGSIDLTVGDGEFVSIIGPSGCGKSTLFNVLAGLELPDSGRVTVSGQDATGRREHFAY